MKRLLVVPVLILLSHLSSHSQVMINEVCAANGDIIYDPDFYNFEGWVELYNAGSTTANIGGYFLSDDPSTKNKWRIPTGTTIPPRGYKLVWCDGLNTGLHTNFNVDPDGETVVLSNAGMSEIDRIDLPSQHLNISYGRIPDGGSVIGYMVNPSPGVQNNSATGAGVLEEPSFSLSPGRYSGTQQVAISHRVSGVQIRYTTDGAEPNSSSPLYSQPIPLSSTRTVKAKAFLEGYLPGPTKAATYFINERSFNLPVVSLSLRPAYLNDNTIGIYVSGTNGVTGNCRDNPVNWNRDWDRHAVFEYFGTNGSRLFDYGVDIRIGGACSRNNPQKSLAIKARDKYGKKTLEYDFFPNKEYGAVGGFMLRNSGNDFWHTMFRDALLQRLPVGQMDIDYMDYQPTAVFINGQYWGIQNIREKIDADYIEANYGVMRDDLDLIETWGTALEGSTTHYNVFMDSLQRIDLSTDEAFDFISRYIDVQEFINYLTAEIYYGNTDWPGNNVKFWRQRSNGGKFRWILWDTDFGFALYTDQSYATHPTLDFATATNAPGWPNPPWSTLQIRLLLQNSTFRNKLIQTLTTSLSTTFSPERVVGIINEFQSRIAPEVPYHVTRWGQSLNNWNAEVERLRVFARERNDFMQTYIPAFFGLDERVRISATALPAGTGKVKLNGITSDAVTDALYFKGIPFEIAPAPDAGYKFSHYHITKRESTEIRLIDRGAAWRYFDGGVLPAGDWMSSEYSDVIWTEGNAQLGYGEGDEATVLSYGPDASNKRITTYFRKEINVADTIGFGMLSGTALYDDGVVIYLNGEEVYRGNMPSGTITYSTVALQAIPSETTYFPFTIPAGKIKPGRNVIAVELHQNSPASSDLSFDLDLRTYKTGEPIEFTTSTPVFSDLTTSDVSIEVHYEPVNKQEGIIINEFSASNSVYEDSFGEKDDWIELYNKGTEPVDIGGFFITDNLNQKTKYRIPLGDEETVVQPGEYKLLWADEQVGQGPLHLSFKLSADGEQIGIYQKVGADIIKVDELTYGAQQTNTSYSRIPNITGPFLETAKYTPLAENELEIPTDAEENVEQNIQVFPNPTTSSIKVVSVLPVRSLVVFDLAGRPVKSLSGLSETTDVVLDDLPAGLYSLVFTLDRAVLVKRVVKL